MLINLFIFDDVWIELPTECDTSDSSRPKEKVYREMLQEEMEESKIYHFPGVHNVPEQVRAHLCGCV